MACAATKATLKVLGLCALLLLVAVAVTVSVAVMVWHAEAARRLKGCQDQGANETAVLVDRVAELERDRDEKGRRLEKLTRREKDLHKQLNQVKESRNNLNATLLGCLENTTLLDANLTAIQQAMSVLQAKGLEMGSQNGALLVEMAHWQQEVAGLEEKLKAAVDDQVAAEAEKGHCEARQVALQESIHSYLSEIASLQRRLHARSSSGRRRCPPFRYLLWVLASFCILFPLEGLNF